MNSPRLKSRPYWDQFPVIPLDWSAEQALAVFELLDILRDRLWLHYGIDIQNLLREQHCSGHVGETDPLDDPPF